MHADNKKNDEGPQVVYPGQTGVIMHFFDFFSGMVFRTVVKPPLPPIRVLLGELVLSNRLN